MRVPILRPGQNTRPSAQGRNYLDGRTNPVAFGAGVGEAISGIGQAISGAIQQVKQRNDKTQRFKTATDFSEFRSMTTEKLEELRRTTDPAKINFVDAVEEVYDTSAQNFLAEHVPPELQDEYRLRIQQYKTGIVTKSLGFQYTEQDKYYRQELADEWNTSLTRVRNDPDSLKQESDRLGSLVLESDLSDIEKRELARNMRFGLLAATYKGAVAQGDILPSAIGIGSSDEEVYYAAVKQAESGGNPNAKSKTASASGLYGFTDGTWAALVKAHPEAGLTIAGKNDPAQQEIGIRLLTKDNEKILAANGVPINNTTRYMAHFLGPGMVDNVMAAGDDTRMADVVSPAYIKANSFLRSMTVADFKAWAAKKAGGADPRFASLPFSDKEALYKDVMAEDRRRQAAEDSVNKSLYDQRIAQLEAGIIQGTVGHQQLQGAFNQGNVNASDYWRMRGRIDKVNEDGAALSQFVQANNAGIPVDFTDTKMKKAADTAYNFGTGTRSGSAHIRSRDQSYADAQLGIARNTHMIAPAYGQDLTNMLYANDPQDILFGARNISALSRARPNSAASVFGADTRKRADLINAVGEVMGQEKASEFAAGFADTERMRNRELWEKQAGDILTKAQADNGYEKAFEAADISQGSTNPHASAGLWRDYSTAFTVGMMEGLGEEAAHKYAETVLQREWGEQELNGRRFVMKYPANKMWGLPDDDVDEMVRTQANLTTDDQYQIIADAQTRQEVNGGKTPSYFVVNMETGETIRTADGRPLRVGRKMDEAFQARTEHAAAVAEQEDRLAQIYHAEVRPIEDEILHLKGNYVDHPKLPELYKQLKEARKRYDEQKQNVTDLTGEYNDQTLERAKKAEATETKRVKENVDIELSESLVGDIQTQFTEVPASEFVRVFIERGDTNKNILDWFTQQGPMHQMMRQDPAYVKDQLKSFKKTAGLSDRWDTLPLPVRLGVYDAFYTEREVYNDKPLAKPLQDFIEDREPTQSAYIKLQQNYDVYGNQEDFYRAMMQRAALRAIAGAM